MCYLKANYQKKSFSNKARQREQAKNSFKKPFLEYSFLINELVGVGGATTQVGKQAVIQEEELWVCFKFSEETQVLAQVYRGHQGQECAGP